jgi:DNA modification methylase
MGEVDMLITGDGGDGEDDEADWLPEAELGRPVVTQPDDLWRLGPHRLSCGNALQVAAYDALLGEEKAEMVFTDPPYNVKIDGHVSGLGSVRHDEFAMASGEMTYQEFVTFLNKALGLGAAYSRDGSIHFVCMDWRHLRELLEAGSSVFTLLKNICVWAKPNAGMGSLYRSQHELIGVFKKGIASHINNVALGSYGRHRSNVWNYTGMNSFGAGRAQALAAHPTVKPVALVRDAILDCSNRGGIVLDAFAGSGTTIIAAERTGRRGYGMELEPRYVDLALRRFQRLTGTEAVHALSGMTFGERERASAGLPNAKAPSPAPQAARRRARSRHD